VTIQGNGRNIDDNPSASLASGYISLTMIYSSLLDAWYIL